MVFPSLCDLSPSRRPILAGLSSDDLRLHHVTLAALPDRVEADRRASFGPNDTPGKAPRFSSSTVLPQAPGIVRSSGRLRGCASHHPSPVGARRSQKQEANPPRADWPPVDWSAGSQRCVLDWRDLLRRIDLHVPEILDDDLDLAEADARYRLHDLPPHLIAVAQPIVPLTAPPPFCTAPPRSP